MRQLKQTKECFLIKEVVVDERKKQNKKSSGNKRKKKNIGNKAGKKFLGILKGIQIRERRIKIKKKRN